MAIYPTCSAEYHFITLDKKIVKGYFFYKISNKCLIYNFLLEFVRIHLLACGTK